MIFKIWSSLFLLVCAIIDIKTKKVYQNICIINYVFAIGIKILINELDIKWVVEGMILCTILFAISIITGEAIGRGDIFIFFALTGILNVLIVMEILLIAMCMCSVFSMILLIMKKKTWKNVIPFVPFIFMGNCIWIFADMW